MDAHNLGFFAVDGLLSVRNQSYAAEAKSYVGAQSAARKLFWPSADHVNLSGRVRECSSGMNVFPRK